MVKRMLGITTLILLNSLVHSTPYQSKEPLAPYAQHKKKNSLKAPASHKEPHIETVHDSNVKKNSKFVGNNG